MRELILATHNKDKIGELSRFLLLHDITPLVWMDQLPEPEETESTFTGNAILKAKLAAKISGKLALADDSGLCIHVLGDFPGVVSARFAKDEGGFLPAMLALEKRLLATGTPPWHWHASFVCAVALAQPNGTCEAVEEHLHGTIVFPPQGTGFGYDPIFSPEGFPGETFGSMRLEQKEAMSHRTKALKKLFAKTAFTAHQAEGT